MRCHVFHNYFTPTEAWAREQALKVDALLIHNLQLLFFHILTQNFFFIFSVLGQLQKALECNSKVC